MITVNLEVGYHATRRASVRVIMDEGLLPSAPERQTTDKRWDCEGNIYLCERLGTPADASMRGSELAHCGVPIWPTSIGSTTPTG
jgi:hypothetical protein